MWTSAPHCHYNKWQCQVGTRSQRHAVSLREALTWLGPSFVKAGQVLASRPDIVREDYMNELCTLQDDVPSFPDDLVSFVMQLLQMHVVPASS